MNRRLKAWGQEWVQVPHAHAPNWNKLAAAALKYVANG